jgi:hypothetical protein
VRLTVGEEPGMSIGAILTETVVFIFLGNIKIAAVFAGSDVRHGNLLEEFTAMSCQQSSVR